MEPNLEYHPRLNLTNLKIESNKIILGSFPSFGNDRKSVNHISKNVTGVVYNKRIVELPYFFGSKTNRFWHWYKSYFDETLNIDNINSISKSLIKNNVGITDLILSCYRKGTSSLDKNLINRLYNHNFFSYPPKNETLKFLCTSKRLMNEMLLNKSFFILHPLIDIDNNQSEDFQARFVKKINGVGELIKKPICVVLKVGDCGYIECLAIPSPGSPYRKLENFGYRGNQLDEYLDLYLEQAFQWFRI